MTLIEFFHEFLHYFFVQDLLMNLIFAFFIFSLYYSFSHTNLDLVLLIISIKFVSILGIFYLLLENLLETLFLSSHEIQLFGWNRLIFFFYCNENLEYISFGCQAMAYPLWIQVDSLSSLFEFLHFRKIDTENLCFRSTYEVILHFDSCRKLCLFWILDIFWN